MDHTPQNRTPQQTRTRRELSGNQKCARQPSHGRANRAQRQIVRIRVTSLKTSYEQVELYGRIDYDHPDMIELLHSIEAHGLKEPVIVTRDNFIISGHRRHAAYVRLGRFQINAIRRPWTYKDNRQKFSEELRHYNVQRKKTVAQEFRESVFDTSGNQLRRVAFANLVSVEEAEGNTEEPTYRTRDRIGPRKMKMLSAVQEVLRQYEQYLPITVRKIHYGLLNDPPLKDAADPESIYCNDVNSYKNLVSLLTRARIEGFIDWDAITDETRTLTTWLTWDNAALFFNDRLKKFLNGYARNVLQSQPNFIVVMSEKQTCDAMTQQITRKFVLPTICGRGFSSVDSLHEVYLQYQREKALYGKKKIIPILMTDFDPDGEGMVDNIWRFMRDDMGLASGEIVIHKAALRLDQIDGLHENATEAKETSTRFPAWKCKYGAEQLTYELEALEPAVYQDILVEAIESLINVDLFNGEAKKADTDVQQIAKIRRQSNELLAGIKLDNP